MQSAVYIKVVVVMNNRIRTITTTEVIAGQVCTKCLICEESVVIGDRDIRIPMICRKCKKAVMEMRKHTDKEGGCDE